MLLEDLAFGDFGPLPIFGGQSVFQVVQPSGMESMPKRDEENARKL